MTHLPRKEQKRRGHFLIEFAIVTPLLATLLFGVTDVGMILTTANTVSQVCRNANVLVVRGIDMSTAANQSLLMRTAQGLGLNQAGTYTPDPNGKGVIYLTKVMLVGPNECNAGITNWDQKPADCPNYNQYVIASYLAIGNSTQWVSPIGKPATTVQSNGSLYDSDIATNTGNRAKGFGAGGAITLTLDQYTFVSEVYVSGVGLDVFHMFTQPFIHMRNLT